MNRTTLIAFLTVSSICFLDPQCGKAQSDPMIVVRVFESVHPFHKSEITITDGNKILNTLELKRYRPKNMGENARRIALILKSVESEGYEMKHANASGNSWYSVKDYIFSKP